MNIDPLPEALRELVAAEPVSPSLDPEVEARLLARLDASVGVAVVEALAVKATVGLGKAAPISKASIALGVGLFAAGALTGAVGHSTLSEPEQRPAIVIEAPRLIAPSPVTIPPVPEPKPVVLPHVTASVRPHPPEPVASTLEAERRLLEPARAALARGLTHNSLELLAQHAKYFPNGMLAEEREALLVQALAQSGASVEARQHASDFSRAYPESLFLPVVERAVTDSYEHDK